jgi:hypothetical protein
MALAEQLHASPIGRRPDQLRRDFPRGTDRAGRIPNGDTPADLPVQRSTNFDLMVNLKAAEVLDITVLSSILTCPRR